MNIRCDVCNHDYEIPVTEEQVSAWRNGTQLVQRAFPFLTDGQRELLISGTCGNCFDEMFAEPA